jgi:hypothetical protein
MRATRAFIPGFTDTTGLYISLPTQNPIDLYVATTGDDTSGDGSAGNPWLTIQKGLDEAAKLRNDASIRVNVANGTYVETIEMPISAQGRIELLGDIVTRTNVVIDGGFNSVTVDHSDGNAEWIIDGFRITGGAVGIFVDNANKTIVKNVEFDGQAFGALAINSSFFTLEDNVNGDAAFDGTGIPTAFFAIGGGNRATLTLDQSFTVTDMIQMLETDTACNITIASGNTPSVTLKDTANTVGISIKRGSFFLMRSPVTITGNAARTDDIGIKIFEGSPTVIEADITFNDLAKGWRLQENSFVEAGSQTFTYNNCTVDFEYDSTSTYVHDNQFDATPIAAEDTTVNVGYDLRGYYMNLLFG